MSREEQKKSCLKSKWLQISVLSMIFMLCMAGNLFAEPFAVIDANPKEGLAPLTVQFDGSESYDTYGDPLTSYMWDFGDGSGYNYEINPLYVFNNPGDYQVVLNVYEVVKSQQQ